MPAAVCKILAFASNYEAGNGGSLTSKKHADERLSSILLRQGSLSLLRQKVLSQQINKRSVKQETGRTVFMNSLASFLTPDYSVYVDTHIALNTPTIISPKALLGSYESFTANPIA